MTTKGRCEEEEEEDPLDDSKCGPGVKMLWLEVLTTYLLDYLLATEQ